MLVELAGAKFPTYYFHYARCPKIEKRFGNIFLKLAELKNVLCQVVNYV